MATTVTQLLLNAASPTSTTPTTSGASIVADVAANWTGLTYVCLKHDVTSIDDARLRLDYSIDAGANWTAIFTTFPIPDYLGQTGVTSWVSIPTAAKTNVTLRVAAVKNENLGSAVQSPIVSRYLETEAR